MKTIQVKNSIPCEYAALGAYGKHTLVNVYTGDIVVQEFPARFPLAFYIEMVSNFEGPTQLQIRIERNSEMIARVDTEFEFNSSRAALMVLPPLAVEFAGESVLRVVGSGEGIAEFEMLKRTVELGSIPGYPAA